MIRPNLDVPSPGGDPGETARRLQALLDRGGEIALTEPGPYPIDRTLVIRGGTALRFGRGTWLSRSGGEGGVLINRGALTGDTDRDILVEGLRLACNGCGCGGGAAVPGLRGQLIFYRVKDLILRDTACDDLPADSYFVHMSNWENVLIDTIRVCGLKDGVHVNRGEHLRLVNGVFRTFDDPIALNAHDYPTGCPELGWIRDVVVEHCVDLDEENTTGFFARILGGAWLSWRKGRMYRHSDAAVASNGCVYRCIAGRDLAEYRSEHEPCHESGDAVYPDGITWRFLQRDAAWDCGCEHVVFRDILLKKKRDVALSIHYDNDAYSRSCYPGAAAVPQKDILLDHVVCEAPIRVLVHGKTPVDCVRVVHSSLRAGILVNFPDPIFDGRNGCRTARVALANNTVSLPEGAKEVTAVRCADGRSARLQMSGNVRLGDFPMTVRGDVRPEPADAAVPAAVSE